MAGCPGCLYLPQSLHNIHYQTLWILLLLDQELAVLQIASFLRQQIQVVKNGLFYKIIPD